MQNGTVQPNCKFIYPRSGHLFDAFKSGVGDCVVVEKNARFEMEDFFACRLNVKQRVMTAVMAAQRPCRTTLQHNSRARALKSAVPLRKSEV